MKCPKCSGKMLYDPPRWSTDTASYRCLCGNRVWEPIQTVMPMSAIPPLNVSKPKTEEDKKARKLIYLNHKKARLEQELQIIKGKMGGIEYGDSCL